MTIQPGVQECCPVVGLHSVQRFHHILERISGRNEAAIVDAKKDLGEIVQRPPAVGQLAD
jgi:hypothetical protein